jgi:hypothetical protein
VKPDHPFWRYFALGTMLFFASCSNVTTGLRVSGEAGADAGDQFVQVAKVFKDGCDVTHSIDPAKCATFRTFGLKFKSLYPHANALWHAAADANDVAATGHARDVILSLASELTKITIDSGLEYILKQPKSYQPALQTPTVQLPNPTGPVPQSNPPRTLPTPR